MLDIYVTSDLWHEIEGTAQWTWYDFTGRKLSKKISDFKVGPIGSTRLDGSVEISAMIPKGQPLNDAWLHLSLPGKDGKYSNEQFFYPLALKDCRLWPTKVVSRPIGRNQVLIEVSEGGVAAWVNVEHPP
ncbi:hypothetical protein O181_088556, partial [Austropuccinia psidii MF-1]|nr:hypothetical protein [Austropuccinia psidii MF-1]